MQTIKQIWEKRLKKLNNKTWNGTDPKPGFKENADKPIRITQTIYSNDNYMDLSIADLRDVLDDLFYSQTPSGLDSNRFTVQLLNGHVPLYHLIDTEKEISIIGRLAEQKQFTIYLGNKTFSLSWCKDHGRIDSFINTEYGDPIDMVECANILVALGLEKEYDTNQAETELFPFKN